jgi:diguanylate cyclase (GGDEF)-like protein
VTWAGHFKSFSRAHVARRLFFLFVLSAFVPLAVVALLTVLQVRTLLLQQGEQRMAALAKSYGMTLFERLLLSIDVGAAAAANPQQSQLAGADALAPRVFRSLGTLDARGGLARLFGEGELPPPAAAVRERIAAGKAAVSILEGPAQPRLLLYAPLGAAGPQAVVGELNPDYLWGPADEAPAYTEFCVAEDRSGRALYCSNPTGRDALAAVLQAPAAQSRIGEWERGGNTMRSRSWAQFMRAQFGTPDWVIVASQPRDVLLARLDQFRQIFMPVVILALLLVTWFTIRQSRHIIVPIAELGERVRQLANANFKGRLATQRTDEFGELALAFDGMSQRLDRQFASLVALSEIDRLILSTQDIAEVIRTVLVRMNEVVAADSTTITLIDHDHAEHARTYFLTSEAGVSASMRRHEMTPKELHGLAAEQGGAWVSVPASAAPQHLAIASARAMARALVQPIMWRGEVCGALVLGYRADREVLEEERQRARELADRVAVAVSSAWRDEQLYVQAHFDGLTGSPNRLLFKDRLDLEIARSRREGLHFALLFVDLDHFKTVNDSYGHSQGDLVLREAATRIARCVRGSDTVGRQGGDEFTVLLTNLHHPQEAWLIAESIVGTLSRPFLVGEEHCFLSASVGIASFPQDGESAEVLLKCADTAMYRAKAAGRGQTVFFEERMNAEAMARLSLDRDLRLAIERGEMSLHYQPQVDLRSGAVSGAEALIRWTHPEKGPISPARFIPLAEESGYIDQIGSWTLREACAQMRRWRDGGLPLRRVSVNVSPRQFRKSRLVEAVRSSAESTGLPAECLEIEITEGMLLDRGEAVQSMLQQLAEAGHAIALDDFGTGFSSMSYLQRLPVEAIKIDRVFVEGLGRSRDSDAIVAAIIALSHAMGKRVIAEGAETAEQVARLRELGCNDVQGFHFARPLPAPEFEAWVRGRAQALALEALQA